MFAQAPAPQRTPRRVASLALALLCLMSQALLVLHTFVIPHWCCPSLSSTERDPRAHTATTPDPAQAPRAEAASEDGFSQLAGECPCELAKRPLFWGDIAREPHAPPSVIESTGPPAPAPLRTARSVFVFAPKNSPPA